MGWPPPEEEEVSWSAEIAGALGRDISLFLSQSPPHPRGLTAGLLPKTLVSSRLLYQRDYIINYRIHCPVYYLFFKGMGDPSHSPSLSPLSAPYIHPKLNGVKSYAALPSTPLTVVCNGPLGLCYPALGRRSALRLLKEMNVTSTHILLVGMSVGLTA